MAGLEKRKMEHVIGSNLKKARQIANLSMSEVMLKIWKVDNNKNRLSEIENGTKFPTVPQLFQLSELYGVSIDYIYGRTREPEIDLQSQRSGSIMQGLRETGLELMERIAVVFAKQSQTMPPHESEILLNAAKLVIREYKKINLTPLPDSFNTAFRELEMAALLLDTKIARQQRTIELTIQEQINAMDRTTVNRCYTDNRIQQLGLDITPASIEDEAD